MLYSFFCLSFCQSNQIKSLSIGSIFPPYPPPRSGLASLVPTLDAVGVDLLSKMLQYDPARRITAQTALEHEFFAEMRRVPGPPPP